MKYKVINPPYIKQQRQLRSRFIFHARKIDWNFHESVGMNSDYLLYDHKKVVNVHFQCMPYTQRLISVCDITANTDRDAYKLL